eukprot:TRINITY_DN3865_c0_g1_i1.p1 TRINITY_DN3865_c0_g1~~TRINITY_DN3865_c0_g1_i1.p1  ORF type:complete len:169 (+),score=30.98 TRINITY_DN3865_c0_g1_i1:306-812(+)
MGRFFLHYLSGSSVYICNKCNCHFANVEDLLSKGFRGSGGKAYLFKNVVNFLVGDLEDRTFTSGDYTVRDLLCLQCMEVIGWRYEVSKDPSQQYKEGKFIIEKIKMTKVPQQNLTGSGAPLVSPPLAASPPSSVPAASSTSPPLFPYITGIRATLLSLSNSSLNRSGN